MRCISASSPLLFALNFLLPDYHHGLLARIMVLAVFAMGYNLLFGYVGLLSLGHAMFFAAGLYGAGLAVIHLGWSVPAAFAAGHCLRCGAGAGHRPAGAAHHRRRLHDRHHDVRAGRSISLILYFAAWTGGDQGLVVPQPARVLALGGDDARPHQPDRALHERRWRCSAVVLLVTLAIVRSRYGRVLVAIRENEERTKMLGYDTFANKLAAVVVSGAICAAAGAAYALLFGYVGSTFASVQYSILPLLWVLLGGAATTLGPLSARCSCTMSSTSPAATPPPIC